MRDGGVDEKKTNSKIKGINVQLRDKKKQFLPHIHVAKTQKKLRPLDEMFWWMTAVLCSCHDCTWILQHTHSLTLSLTHTLLIHFFFFLLLFWFPSFGMFLFQRGICFLLVIPFHGFCFRRVVRWGDLFTSPDFSTTTKLWVFSRQCENLLKLQC